MLTPTLTPFLDKPTSPGDVEYTLFAAPLDATTSNRRGTRYAPNAIRRESVYLDTLSPRTGLDWDDLSLADVGDLQCMDVETALREVEETVREAEGLPVMLGGEHTVTLGALRALNPETVVVFDAHLDLRDSLFGEKLCHATYLRRAHEELGFKAVVIGPRALSREEVDYAKLSPDISYYTSQRLLNGAQEELLEELRHAGSVYLSVDMDALDPSCAPAVGNPHPEGLSTRMLMDFACVAAEKMVGFDLNEVYPHYDNGNTAVTAAYIVMETLYAHKLVCS